MRLLLDTHTLIWWWTDDQRLSGRAKRMISDASNEVLVSAASAWEMATKMRRGKLRGIPDALPRFAELIAADGFQPLPIHISHAIRAGAYEVSHRDPFDRVLAAQSELESLELVSKDRAFRLFPVQRLW